MKLPNKPVLLLLVSTLMLLISVYTLNAGAVPQADAPGYELPDPPESPDEPDPDPQPQPDSPNSANPCLPSTPSPVNLDPFVGHVSEPGMPLGFSLGQAVALSDDCISFLRTKATGEGIAQVGISLKGDGTDLMRMTIRDAGIPAGTTFVRTANVSDCETLGFGVWASGNPVWHVTVGPKTPTFYNGAFLARPGFPVPVSIASSVIVAESIYFDRPVLWWFDTEAYWSQETFWKLFDGKQVDFLYIGKL